MNILNIILSINVGIQFSIFDFLIFIAIVWGVYKGYKRGFIVHIISLFALITGIFIAIKMVDSIYLFLADKSTVPLTQLPVILFVILFLLIIFGTHIAADIIEKTVQSLEKKIIDRTLGVAFNIIKYMFFISIFLIFIQKIDNSAKFITNDEREASKLLSPFTKFASSVFPYLDFKITHKQAFLKDDGSKKVDKTNETKKTNKTKNDSIRKFEHEDDF